MANLFTDLNPEPLAEAAKVAIRDSLRVQESERVLIITNPVKNVYEVAIALYNAAMEAGAEAVLTVQPVKSQFDFADEAVIEAISSNPDVCISISAGKLGKDRRTTARPYSVKGRKYDHVFRYLLGIGKLRSFWSPKIDQDMFARTIPVNYEKIAEQADGLKKVLDTAKELRITAPAGTDLKIGVDKREALVDNGKLSFPGQGGNLPAGEAFISPELGRGEGKIVFDGSISLHNGDLLNEEPVEVIVEEGIARHISGGREADLLRETIEMSENNAFRYEKEGQIPAGKGKIYSRNARNLGELGIGLNPNAKITGNMLEDEKAFGTCHLALGSNYDQDAPSLTHLDCLVRSPSIKAVLKDGDEIDLLEEGRLLIED